MKTIPRELIKAYAIPHQKVVEIFDDEIIIPTQEYVNANLDRADQAIYKRFKDWHQ